MKNITAVIGANYGDEGKGLMTDYFCSKAEGKVLNVRFNSGAQAGHTVIANGKRHIFGHIGSGTFANADTYLSNFFVVSPLIFIREITDLQLKMLPKVYVAPNCYVTTPYEMLLNQMIETHRGNNRHGSCGLGFHETIVRNEKDDLPIHVSDLKSLLYMRRALDHIRIEYVPRVLEEMNIPMTPSALEVLRSEEFMGKFLDDCTKFQALTETFEAAELLPTYDNIVFEGAQGLLLDQDYGTFPHVTHSNTGLKNVAALMEACGLQNEILNPVYITRWYMTRHGNGPFPTEVSTLPHPLIAERTNHANEWQGQFRFGLLDLDELFTRINYDLQKYWAFDKQYTKTNIAITCLDQCDEEIQFLHSGRPMSLFKNELPLLINYFDIHLDSNLGKIYHSYGPSRDDVKQD